MQIGANILPVFEQLGLLEEVRKISLPCIAMEIYNSKLDKVAVISGEHYEERYDNCSSQDQCAIVTKRRLN